jgi:hypothetical protein
MTRISVYSVLHGKQNTFSGDTPCGNASPLSSYAHYQYVFTSRLRKVVLFFLICRFHYYIQCAGTDTDTATRAFASKNVGTLKLIF